MFVPRMLAKIVDKVARQSVGKDWSLYAALLERWPEIVGTDYAQVTTPVKISFPHQPREARQCGGTLCVRLPKGLAMEFTFKADQIKQRINGYFGYDAVAKIAFEPVFGAAPVAAAKIPEADPLVLKKIKETAQTLEDAELRSALESFGTAVAKHAER